MALMMRDQPDQVKTDFLNNLTGLDQLAASQLQYILAYRWSFCLGIGICYAMFVI
jgi:hypothetical protein